MSDEETESMSEVETPSEPVWPYDLGDIKSIEGTEVTEDHRADAMNATDCECFTYMKAAVSELSPGFRRYGQTLAKIATQFLEAQGTIQEEMTRIAHRNLRCVVTGNLGNRRVLNAQLATHEKEMRNGAREHLRQTAPVEEPESAPVEEPEFAPVDNPPTPDFLKID